MMSGGMEYDREFMNKLADSIEEYVRNIDRYVIIPGVDAAEYNEAMKKTKKLIKHLRKGKGDKVFDPERYAEIVPRLQYSECFDDGDY